MISTQDSSGLPGDSGAAPDDGVPAAAKTSSATFETLDGNEAAALVAYRLNEVMAIYPITPSSPIAEWCDRYSPLVGVDDEAGASRGIVVPPREQPAELKSGATLRADFP
jgi:hypothetical protein